MTDALIVRHSDKQVHTQAKRAGLEYIVADGPLAEEQFDRALIAGPAVTIPWDLVDYGLHFCERWDAAAPLWRYGVLAKDVGSDEDRKRTEAVVRDLRVPLYACELLFVQKTADGLALLNAWEEAGKQGGDQRMAFLRALYQVKPRFCALPRSWLGGTGRYPSAASQSRGPAATGSRPRRNSDPSRTLGAGGPATQLVRVKLGPGVYVRCHPGDEQKVYDRLTRKGRRK